MSTLRLFNLIEVPGTISKINFPGIRFASFSLRRQKSQSGILFGLLTVIALACFWSTALVEIGAALLIIVVLVYTVLTDNVRNFSEILRSEFPPLLSWTFSLWFLYVAGVFFSFRLNGVPFSQHPGLLWHPFVFPATFLAFTRKEKLPQIGKGFVISGAVASTVVMFQHLVLTPDHQLSSFIGLTTFADLLALAGVVSIVYFVAARNRPTRTFAVALASFVLTLTLIESSELAPLSALVIAGSLIVFKSSTRGRLIWLGLMAGALLIGPSNSIQKLNWMIHGHSIDRYIVWSEGIRLLADAPVFGFGPDCYEKILPAETWAKFAHRPPGSWHNDFLETGLESGVLTAIALVLLTLLVCYSGFVHWRNRSGSSTDEALPILNLLFLCMTGFTLVGGAITTTILGVLFWMLVGLNLRFAVGPTSSSRNIDERQKSESRGIDHNVFDP